MELSCWIMPRKSLTNEERRTNDWTAESKDCVLRTDYKKR